MKAAVSTRYGPPKVVKICEVAKPAPGAGDVLVRVHATTVSRSDCGMRRGHPFFIRALTGLFRPRNTILGMDFAGEVEAVGAGVTSFAPGDRVFGLSPDSYGAHAEYLCVPEKGPIAAMPAGLDHAEAVLCEGAWYANTYLEDFDLRPGQSILIYGASGAIGTAAVQLAKARGAEVTAVASTQHMDLVKTLGADHAVDYTAGDFTAIGQTYDFVLDAVGKTSYFECRPLLKPDGRFSATDLGPAWQNIWLPIWMSMTGRRRVTFPMPNCSKALIEFIRTRMETGELRAVIDRRYRLDDIVEAYRYVETAKKTGIVVIEMTADDSAGMPAA
jgi:NADPH:quinone reductase-like Zn-dependent oxidoreductase